MAKVFGFTIARPEQRGYWCGTYDIAHSPKQCPGCGRHQWIIGRLLAECAFCSTAVPLVDAQSGSTVIVHKNMTRRAEQRREVQVAA
jgi:hypothetical protein